MFKKDYGLFINGIDTGGRAYLYGDKKFLFTPAIDKKGNKTEFRKIKHIRTSDKIR